VIFDVAAAETAAAPLAVTLKAVVPEGAPITVAPTAAALAAMLDVKTE
jgi:hypothetical protein